MFKVFGNDLHGKRIGMEKLLPEGRYEIDSVPVTSEHKEPL